jgi:hypothetical protein
VRIQIAVGERLSEAGADRMIHQLALDKLKGFTMERDGTRFEVERGFTRLRAVLIAIKRLHRDGFRTHLEVERHK